MSIALYACKAKEAEKLKSKGVEISVDEDLDGNERINITREDGNEVKFNNLYNCTEIDERILGEHFDLKGFPWITTNEDGVLPVLNTDGTLEESRAQTFYELYEVIKSNIENIKQYFQSVDSNAFDANSNINELSNKLNELINEHDITNLNVLNIALYLNELLNGSTCIECVELMPEDKNNSISINEADEDEELHVKVPNPLQMYINKLTYEPSSISPPSDLPEPSPGPTPEPPTGLVPPTIDNLPTTPYTKPIIPYQPPSSTPSPSPTPIPSPTADVYITPSPPSKSSYGSFLDNSTSIAYYPNNASTSNNITTYEYQVNNINSIIRYLNRNNNNLTKAVVDYHNNFSKYISNAFLGIGAAVGATGLAVLAYDKLVLHNRFKLLDGKIEKEAIEREQFDGTLNQYANDVNYNINFLGNQLEILRQKVNAINPCTCNIQRMDDLERDLDILSRIVNGIKSCECNHNDFNSNFNELQNDIKSLRSEINNLRYRTNINFNQLAENTFERPAPSMLQHQTQTFNLLRTISNQFVDININAPSVSEINTNTSDLFTFINQSVQVFRDRNWEDAPPYFVWDIRYNEWQDVDINEPYPNNWRNDRNYIAPPNYIRDFNRGDYVRFTSSTNNIDENWRNDLNSSIPYAHNSFYTRGRIEWRNGEWVWNSNHDNIHDRNWIAPREYIWNLVRGEWMINNEVYQGDNWRYDNDAEVSDMYIFDSDANEWVVINTEIEYETNWRTRREPTQNTQNMIDTVNTQITEGNIVWSNQLYQWVWQRSSTAEDILNNRESSLIPADYVWYIQQQRFVRILGYNNWERFHGDNNWRHDVSLNVFIPNNYIYDIGYDDWVMIDSDANAFENLWRLDRNSQDALRLDVMLREYGTVSWINDDRGWVLRPHGLTRREWNQAPRNRVWDLLSQR